SAPDAVWELGVGLVEVDQWSLDSRPFSGVSSRVGFRLKITALAPSASARAAGSSVTTPQTNATRTPGRRRSTLPATARPAPGRHGAVVALADAVDHRQAQPGAFAGRLGGEERIEDALDDGRIDAGSGVGDGQAGVAAGLQPGQALLRGDIHGGQRDRDPADV